MGESTSLEHLTRAVIGQLNISELIRHEHSACLGVRPEMEIIKPRIDEKFSRVEVRSMRAK
jgi:hypothetical protein